jgi:hypothetical protein
MVGASANEPMFRVASRSVPKAVPAAGNARTAGLLLTGGLDRPGDGGSGRRAMTTWGGGPVVRRGRGVRATAARARAETCLTPAAPSVTGSRSSGAPSVVRPTLRRGSTPPQRPSGGTDGRGHLELTGQGVMPRVNCRAPAGRSRLFGWAVPSDSGDAPSPARRRRRRPARWPGAGCAAGSPLEPTRVGGRRAPR